MFDPDFQINFNTNDHPFEVFKTSLQRAEIAIDNWFGWRILTGNLYISLHNNHGYKEKLHPYQYALIGSVRGAMDDQKEQVKHVRFVKNLVHILQELGCETEFNGFFAID